MKTQTFASNTFHPWAMDVRKPVQEMRLTGREILRLDGTNHGIYLNVVKGRMWISQAGDPNDHFLSSGEAMVISGKGLILAQGWPDAVVRVDS